MAIYGLLWVSISVSRIIVCAKKHWKLWSCRIKIKSLMVIKRVWESHEVIVEPSHKTLNLRNINGYQRISTRLSIDPLKTVPLHQYDWTHQSMPNHPRPQGLHFFHGWRSGTPLFFGGDCKFVTGWGYRSHFWVEEVGTRRLEVKTIST